jgi:hypothetical protein
MWYTFAVDALHFFMADTRSERQARSLHDIGAAQIMHPAQMQALLTWLRQKHGGPRFIVTASAMGLRRRDLVGAGEAARLRSDSWEGFPASMHALLATICLERIENVVFLSGDEHISCEMTLTLSAAGRAPVRARSIHASPLYAPYPFANSRSRDFMPSPDRFSFGWVDAAGAAVDISCAVEARFIDGDGFALVTVAQDGEVSVSFDRAERTAPAAAAPAGHWRHSEAAVAATGTARTTTPVS